MKNTLFTATLLLFLATAAAAQVHDIEVVADYSESVGGIRLVYNGTAIMDDFANLTVGRTYEIRYKVRNNGDYSEKANITVLALNLTRTWEINHRSRTVGAGKSIYLSENWNTTYLWAGNYSILVRANISADSNSSNDFGMRKVILFGQSKSTTTTSTTRAEPEERETTTTRTTTTTRKASTTTQPQADNDSVVVRRFDPIVNIGCFDEIMDHGETGVDCGGPCSPCAATTTTRSTTSRTTSVPRKTSTTTHAGTTFETTTSTSAARIEATGKVTSIPAEGRQAVVTFLILFAGAALYLSKK
jgi:hypothetical protein